jgi:hypothetical protein
VKEQARREKNILKNYIEMNFYNIFQSNKELLNKMALNVMCILLSGVATITIVILLSQHTYYLLAALFTLLSFLQYMQPRSIFLYVFCGLGGMLTESAAIKYSSNTWHYSTPTKPLNIPIWLGLVWSLAAVLIVSLNDLIAQINELYKIKLNNHLEIIS